MRNHRGRSLKLAIHFGALIAIVLAGGFFAAALVRYSPGFDSIPEDADPRISPVTLQALHAQHDRENSLPVFYARYLGSAFHGDLGISQSLKQPVSDLIADRAPATLWLILLGTAGGCLLGGLLAWLAVWSRRAVVESAAASISGLFLAVPPAVLGLLFFFYAAPLALALSLALLPRVFGTARAVFEDCYASPALLAARSRGTGPVRIALRYVLGKSAPQLIALLGVVLVLAFGSAIPIESLCGVAGLGALALQAAISRDMPLLCGLALVITFFIAFVHTAGSLAIGERA